MYLEIRCYKVFKNRRKKSFVRSNLPVCKNGFKFPPKDTLPVGKQREIMAKFELPEALKNGILKNINMVFLLEDLLQTLHIRKES